ncbi:hypothetical protein [Leadbetterella sp. DM7]|uniref:hypothetical protein n=1 Tax=Leadbetterella sp. DM7 TaxID=3235085 RepID=UPI00349E5AE2
MKKLILVSWALMAAHFSGAQEKKQYEVKNFKGLVNITGPSSGLVIEGYAGNSVIIEAEGGEGKVPEKAAGLRMVTAGGVDNTGISARVEEETVKVVTSINEKGEEKEEEIRVLTINIPNANKLFKNYVIKVPHGVMTRFRESHMGYWGGKEPMQVRSFEGELEVSCTGCNMNISDFSGNIIANNSSYGGTTHIEFSKLAQDKISSINTDGDVEVILPASTKANLTMNSTRGNAYTDFELKKVEKKTGNDRLDAVIVNGLSSFSSSGDAISVGQGNINFRSDEGVTVVGQRARVNEKLALASVSATRRRNLDRYDYTINDGGVYFSITSFSGNVYLKKK